MLGVFIALGNHFNEVSFTFILGDVIVMAGVICSSIFAAFSSNYIEKYGNLNVLLFALISGVSAMLIAAFSLGSPLSGSLDFNLSGWSYVFVLGIPCGAIMIYCWGKALQLATPTQASLCMGFTHDCNVIGLFMLNEKITLNLLIGFTLVFLAVLFIQIKTEFI